MKVRFKISFILIIFFILTLVLSTSIQAANESLQIIKSGDDYIIYLDGLEKTKFSFAFSNTQENEKLKYYSNWTDSNGVNIACIDNQSNIDLTKPIFMFITDEKGNLIISAREIDLNQVLNLKDIEKLDSLTKRISVDLSQTVTTNEHVDGITKTKTTGKLVITDSSNYFYRYNLQKITEGTEVSNFNNLLNDLNNNSGETMSEKIALVKNVDTSFNELVNKASWQKVSDMTINQPAESKNGDVYLALLQKVDGNGNVVESDAQILKCSEIESQEKVSESIPVKYTTALPITGENLVLYIVFAIILILIVVMIIKIVKSNKKDERK